jgi:hypothetical protein
VSQPQPQGKKGDKMTITQEQFKKAEQTLRKSLGIRRPDTDMTVGFAKILLASNVPLLKRSSDRMSKALKMMVEEIKPDCR